MTHPNAALSQPRDPETITAKDYREGKAKPVRLKPANVVTLDLPLPPSVNGAWTNVPGKGRVRSQPYRRWHKLAFDELMLQKPGRVVGRFSVAIDVGRIRRRADVDNRGKCLLDLLASIVTDDDAYCERLSIGWSDTVAPERVKVTVRAA